MNPPPNPSAAAARAAMMAHNAPLLQNPPAHSETVLLTWTRDTERTFSDEEIEQWYKIAKLIFMAAQTTGG